MVLPAEVRDDDDDEHIFPNIEVTIDSPAGGLLISPTCTNSLERLRQMKRQIRGERSTWQSKLAAAHEHVRVLQQRIRLLEAPREQKRERQNSIVQSSPTYNNDNISSSSPLDRYCRQRSQGWVPLVVVQSQQRILEQMEYIEYINDDNDEWQSPPHRPTTTAAALQAEIDTLTDQLQQADSQIQYASDQMLVLNNQANVYAAHVSTLQTENVRLDAALREAEQKVADMARTVLQDDDDDDDDDAWNVDDFLSVAMSPQDAPHNVVSPQLDQALYVAQGLQTALQESPGDTLSVLKTLEELLDNTVAQQQQQLPAMVAPVAPSTPMIRNDDLLVSSNAIQYQEETSLQVPPANLQQQSQQSHHLPSHAIADDDVTAAALRHRCRVLEQERTEWQISTLHILQRTQSIDELQEQIDKLRGIMGVE